MELSNEIPLVEVCDDMEEAGVCWRRSHCGEVMSAVPYIIHFIFHFVVFFVINCHNLTPPIT
jgi:hypothetical protein